jgi:hypothetical protein
MRMVGLGIQAEEVDGASAARSGADMRHFLAQQGIDEAGLSDVGSAKEGELRRTFRGKELGVGSGGKKFGDDRLHAVPTSVNGNRLFTTEARRKEINHKDMKGRAQFNRIADGQFLNAKSIAAIAISRCRSRF